MVFTIIPAMAYGAIVYLILRFTIAMANAIVTVSTKSEEPSVDPISALPLSAQLPSAAGELGDAPPALPEQTLSD